jgi:hypothetical protein
MRMCAHILENTFDTLKKKSESEFWSQLVANEKAGSQMFSR